MTWAVYAPTTRAAGFLAGIYAGASARGRRWEQGSAPTSWSADRNHTVELQPLSIQEQTGVNIAAGGPPRSSCASCA